MITIWIITIPTDILFLVFATLIFGFMLWRNIDALKKKPTAVFDFSLIYLLAMVLFGRLFYIFQNYQQFSKMSWSIYPYYYLPGAERIWFKQMPLALLKFWDNGLDYSAVFLGGIFSLFVFFSIKNLLKKNYIKAIRGLIVSQIVIVIGYFIGSYYYGKVTQSFFSIQYPNIDLSSRIPLQLIEILVLLGILLLSFIVKKRRLFVGMYLFFFGWSQILIDYLKDSHLRSSSGVSIIQIAYLFMVFIGIVFSVMSLKAASGEKSNLNEIMFMDENKVPSRKRKRDYRSFSTSFSTYRTTKPSIFSRIKRIFSKKPKSEDFN